MRSRIFGFQYICTEFSIENFGSGFEKFSNNFFTFHTVSPKVMGRFSKFWMLVKTMIPLFKTHPTTLPGADIKLGGASAKMIDENLTSNTSAWVSLHIIMTCKCHVHDNVIVPVFS